ncbi:hypothetical protein BDC45DRAFT_509166 [Circinella umbellata]|nr:hypothetical protein BDC45DRAFT_509166 [Circinella umbellata]
MILLSVGTSVHLKKRKYSVDSLFVFLFFLCKKMVLARNMAPTDQPETSSTGRIPRVIPASPVLKPRKKHMPWDTDFGTDNKDSSIERLVKWLLQDHVYRQWQEGVNEAGEPVTKKALTEEFLHELLEGGIDYRRGGDIQTKIYQLEHDFGKARDWIVRFRPKEKDSSTHTEETRSAVVQKCKYYYRLEPVFGKYLGFPSLDDSITVRTPPPRRSKNKNISSSPSRSVSTSAPVQSHLLSSPRTTLSSPRTALSSRPSLYNLIESIVKNQQRIVTNNPHPVNTEAREHENNNTQTSSILPTTATTTEDNSSVPPDDSYVPTSLTILEKTLEAETDQQVMESKERVELERLKLEEKKHNDRMEIKKRKLDLNELKLSQEYDIKKRKSTAETLASHAQLISELRALGLPNADIVDYMKKVENA